MRQRFGFDLSMEAVRLMRRGDGFWYEEAVEKIDGPDIIERLEALVAVVPEGEPVEIFLPGDQILYVDVPVHSLETAAQDIRAALDGRTPYAIEELEFDWTPVADGRVRVATIARDTLDEAADFAAVRGLNVVRYSSLAESSSFPRLPDFGRGVEDWSDGESAPALVLVGQPIEEDANEPPEEVVAPDEGRTAPEGVVAYDAEAEFSEDEASDVPTGREDDEPGTEENEAIEVVAAADDAEAGSAVSDEGHEAAEDSAASVEPPVPVFRSAREEVLDDEVADAASEDDAPDIETLAEVETASHDEAEVRVEVVNDVEADAETEAVVEIEDAGAPDPVDDEVPVLVVESADPVIQTAPTTAHADEPDAGEAEPLTAAQSLEPRVDPIAAWDGREPKPSRRMLPLAAAIAGVLTLGIGWVVWSVLPEGAPVETTAALPEIEPPSDAISKPREDAITDVLEQETVEDDEVVAGLPSVPDLPNPDAFVEGPVIAEVAGPGEAGPAALLPIAGVKRGTAVFISARPAADIWTGPVSYPDPTPEPLISASRYLAEADFRSGGDTDVFGDVVARLADPARIDGIEPLTDVLLEEALILPDALPEELLADPGETGEEAVVIASALPAPTELARALTAITPQRRPTALTENYERAKFGGMTRAELALVRPPARPESAQAVAAQALSESGPAAGASLVASAGATAFSGLQPRTRPEDFEERVQSTIARQASLAPPPDTSAAVRAALARPPSENETAVENARQTARMVIPSGVNVARRATIENVFDMRSLALVGIYGSTSDRRALLRLGNGRYVKVKSGDRVDGGTVAAINATSVIYRKGGRNTSLEMPGG